MTDHLSDDPDQFCWVWVALMVGLFALLVFGVTPTAPQTTEGE